MTTPQTDKPDLSTADRIRLALALLRPADPTARAIVARDVLEPLIAAAERREVETFTALSSCRLMTQATGAPADWCADHAEDRQAAAAQHHRLNAADHALREWLAAAETDAAASAA